MILVIFLSSVYHQYCAVPCRKCCCICNLRRSPFIDADYPDDQRGSYDYQDDQDEYHDFQDYYRYDQSGWMNHESLVVFEAKSLLPENREQLWKVVRLPKSDLMVGAGSINWEGGWMTVNAGVGGNSYSPAAEPCNNFQQDNAMSSNACHSLNHNIIYPFLHTWNAIILTMSVFIWHLKISNIIVSSKFEFESNLLLTEEALFLQIRQLHISIC